MNSRVEASKWIKAHRERRELSVPELATAMGVSQGAAYDWESEKKPDRPAESRVPKLAEVLGVTETEVRRGLGFYVGEDSTSDAADIVDLITNVVRQLDDISEDDLVDVYQHLPSDVQVKITNTAVGVIRLATQEPIRRSG